MEYMDRLVDRFVAELSAFDRGRISAVVENLDEAVVASGRSYLPETIRGEAFSAVVAGHFAVIGLAVLTLAIVYVRLERRGKTVPAWAVVAGGLGAMSAILGTIVGVNASYMAGEHARQGYLITENRVISLGGDGVRTDVPASGIAYVTRSADGMRTTLRSARGHEFVIETEAEQRAAVERAINRLARGENVVVKDAVRGG
jgi:hypothetical protein